MPWADPKVWAGGLRRAGAALLDLIYPQNCTACGVQMDVAGRACLCPACESTLPRIGEWQCPRCADELGPYSHGRRACGSCRDREGLMFVAASSVFRYEMVAREMVHRLKYGRDLRSVDWMGAEMFHSAQAREWYGKVDMVAPVPLHWRRRVSRRFNQSEMLAHVVARAGGLPCLPRALVRLRPTHPQADLTFAERWRNLQGAFGVRRVERIKGRVPLLVDDVMTTCATAAECSRVLLDAGAKAVYVLTFAR